MFTIKMNPAKGKWRIYMRQFGIFWFPIKGAEFETLGEAQEYVKYVGLSEHYDQQVYKGLEGWASMGVIPAHKLGEQK